VAQIFDEYPYFGLVTILAVEAIFITIVGLLATLGEDASVAIEGV
jgi:hypothetical protein